MKKKERSLFFKIFDIRMLFFDFGKWTSALFFWILLRTKKIYITGKKPKSLTRGRFIVATNHVSYIDHFVAATCMANRRMCYVGTTNLLRGKWGWFFKITGTIGIDKDHLFTKAIRQVTDTLDRGHVVCSFPEGIIEDEEKTKPFKGGTVMMSAFSEADILPIYLVKRKGLQRKIAVIGERISYKDLFKKAVPTKEEITAATELLTSKEKELENYYKEKYLKD